MEPANKSLVKAAQAAEAAAARAADPANDPTEIEFLPDADEIERRPLPPYARITVHLLAAMLVLFLLWASFAQVDEVVRAQGRLTTPSANIVVQPIETSIIRTIHVRVGQIVKKGEHLATLDRTVADADQNQLRLKFESLDTQVKRMEAELSGQPMPPEPKAMSQDILLQDRLAGERRANFAAQAARLDQNIGKVKAQLETNLRDQQALEERTKSLREVESMQERLVQQQYGAKVTLLDARNKRMEVERDYTLAKNQETEIRRELGALEAERKAFVNGWRQKTVEDMLGLTRERDALAEQMKKGDLRNNMVELTSPADAMVLEIPKLSQGSVAQAAEHLFTLVPLGSQLDAEVQIDSLDVGHVKPGDDVHLKLDAFPFQKHGTLEARVRSLSEDAFKRDNPNAASGADAYYISRIDIGKTPLKNMEPQARLLPGMTLTAEIVVGKRTVMSYLLWPLTKGLDEAIREP
jgi:HlyD family secretion protein